MRGTTRRAENAPVIEAAGAEAVVADPDRLATLVPQVSGASAVCWLMGSAAAGSEVHGPRLRSFLETLVDTHVRGFVYEAAGAAGAGAGIVRRAGETYRMPVEVLEADPGSGDRWLSDAVVAVREVLA